MKFFHTMDDYEADLRLDDHSDTDIWAGEDEITISGMPKALWCDDDTSKRPAEPEHWVDQLANQVELQRLCSMGVLARAGDTAQLATERLTTKFVHDWRIKSCVDEKGVERKRWLRRSRLVAREYAFWEKRSDTLQPCDLHSHSQSATSDVLAEMW